MQNAGRKGMIRSTLHAWMVTAPSNLIPTQLSTTINDSMKKTQGIRTEPRARDQGTSFIKSFERAQLWTMTCSIQNLGNLSLSQRWVEVLSINIDLTLKMGLLVSCFMIRVKPLGINKKTKRSNWLTKRNSKWNRCSQETRVTELWKEWRFKGLVSCSETWILMVMAKYQHRG